MDPMATGLRFRMRRAARQMSEQHEHIRAVLGDFDLAVAARDRPRVSELFENYRSALEAHFALEDEVFFPGLHGLQPDRAPELDALSEDHQTFLGELDRLAETLHRERVEAFARAFRELVDDLGEHERREEAIVRGFSALLRNHDDGESSSPSSSGVESSS